MKKTSPTKSGRLAEKLTEIRLGLGLSQSELLNRLGFSEHLFRSNISQYERGDRVPSPTVLLEYARLASVNLAVLIDDDLNLPERIPGRAKREGVQRLPKSRKQR